MVFAGALRFCILVHDGIGPSCAAPARRDIPFYGPSLAGPIAHILRLQIPAGPLLPVGSSWLMTEEETDMGKESK